MKVELSLSDLKVIELYLYQLGPETNHELKKTIRDSISQIELKVAGKKGFRKFQKGDILEIGDGFGATGPTTLFDKSDTKESQPNNTYFLGDKPQPIHFKWLWKKIS